MRPQQQNYRNMAAFLLAGLEGMSHAIELRCASVWLQVVTKLFHIVEPDVACFGQKDYQQWRLITRMVSSPVNPARSCNAAST